MWSLYFALSVFVAISNDYSYASMSVQKYERFNQNYKTTVITDSPENCLLLTSQPGYFTYNSTTGKETVCGIYLITDPQNVIQITVMDFDVPCNSSNGNHGLVQYLDGWELNGEIFPNSIVYSSEESEFCSDNKSDKKIFISSQNGALISYQIPEIGKGFTIFVEHRKNPSPCNVIHIDESHLILRNYGNQINCSVWAPYPIAFKFNSYKVGEASLSKSEDCECSNIPDRIEILGGNGLDTNQMQVLDSICNEHNFSSTREEIIRCGTTTITLISSGNYDNYLNVSMRLLTKNENSNKKKKYQCRSFIK